MFLVLFLMIFEGNKKLFILGKLFLSDEEITPFERDIASRRAKIWTNDVTLKYKLRHFQTSEKPKKQ